MLNKSEVFSLEKLYGHRIRVLHRWIDQAMTDALAQMELTPAQGQILGFISRQTELPCARDIARALELSQPTVSGLLTRLEKKGFLAFLPDERDKRARRIYLLPRGEASICSILETIRETEARMVQGFSEEERQQFLTFLNRAAANMDGSFCLSRQPKEE